MSVTYKDAGVDADVKAICSKLMYEASKRTWENRKGGVGEVLVDFDYFSGLRYMDGNKLSGFGISLNMDGVGTKIEIAERLSSFLNDFKCHQGIAFDLFAMVCDDAVVKGAEPILFGSIVDLNRMNVNLISNLAEGMVKAAKEARVAIMNGELAELGDRIGGYGDYRYNWGAVILCAAKKEKLITGKDVKVGDSVVSLREKGFRSNGISLLRKLLKDKFGDGWHEKDFEGENIAELALTPSTIYTSTVMDMFLEGVNVKAIAHITGGGIPEKLGRALKPSKLGAELNNLFEPCELMNYFVENGDVEMEEAYKTWNMGNGMLIVTDTPEEIIKITSKHLMDAKIAGVTTDKNISIASGREKITF